MGTSKPPNKQGRVVQPQIDYICEGCGARFHDQPLQCPKCGCDEIVPSDDIGQDHDHDDDDIYYYYDYDFVVLGVHKD